LAATGTNWIRVPPGGEAIERTYEQDSPFHPANASGVPERWRAVSGKKRD
jgi:hypothetical protein